ncbi:uncharacterized protein LOC130826485 [Amaranthus tricolor]|uniref:uncharacterized protein LOC130826485 n=1 Tax=Amaranthus tricolor TaxID=29722 RepID=UPI00258C6279|nr:uncharacterized protein LOC130826485 [Amaranthus tricolor]
MADEHQLFGQFRTPGSQEFQEGVVLYVAATPYQIHPQFTRMVKETPFSGLSNECPLQNLEAFSDVCGLIPPCPNNPIYVRLHLFHLSLVGDARNWYKCLEPNSITTWAQLKTPFVKRFYLTVKHKIGVKRLHHSLKKMKRTWTAAWSRFKRMIRACPHHEYGDNHLNTFFYDGLNDTTKALLDSEVGGQLSKIPCNQVKAKIEEVSKNSAWGSARSKGLPRGMIDTTNLDTISAKIEAIIDKKLSKLSLVSSSNTSSAREKHFACAICGGTNHDTSYCAVNYGGQGQGAGYVQQPCTNQSHRPPFNSNQNQGNFHPGCNRNVQSGFNNKGLQGNQPSGNALRPSSYRPPGFNQGPRVDAPLVRGGDEKGVNVTEKEEEQGERLRVESERSELTKIDDEEEKQKNEKSTENNKEMKKRIEEKKRLGRLYTPLLPFLYRRVEKQLDEKFKKFLEHLRKMEMKISFLDAMAQMPKYAMFLKDLLSNKKKLEEEIIIIPHQASSIL